MRKRICILMVLMLMFLSGCDLSLDDDAIHAETAAVLDGIVANDYDAVRAGLSQQIMDSSVREHLQALHGELADLGEYQMTAVGMKRKTQNGTTMTAIRYLVSSGDTQFYMDVTKIDGEAGLAGFNLHAFSEDVPVAEPKGALHWGFTILGVAAGIFALWALTDCLRRKPKHRWAWMLLILLVSALLTVRFSGGSFSFRTNAGLYLGMSSLTTYPGGDFEARVYFPLGALTYWIMRRNLTKLPAAEVVDIVSEQEAEAE